MTFPRLTGTHHHQTDNIPDFVMAVQALASGVMASGLMLPPGGATGQTLLKDSGANGDATWHYLEDVATAETDDTLVLAPDGAGGVEFRSETGGGGVAGRFYIPFGSAEEAFTP